MHRGFSTSTLPAALRAGCRLPGARPSCHALSSRACHLLKVRTMNPTAAQLGLRDSTVHAYGHVLPGPSAGNPGTPSSETSAHASLSRCLVTLGCYGTLSNPSTACCWPCSFSQILGSRSVAGFFMGPWVPPLGCFTFFSAIGTCFIQDVSSSHLPHPVISIPTSLTSRIATTVESTEPDQF